MKQNNFAKKNIFFKFYSISMKICSNLIKLKIITLFNGFKLISSCNVVLFM